MFLAQTNRYQFIKQALKMSCRKDILLENDIINKKTRRASLNTIEKIQESVKDNTKRLQLFGVFCVIFSLGFLYDRKKCLTTVYDYRRRPLKMFVRECKARTLGYDKVYGKVAAEIHQHRWNQNDERWRQVAQTFIRYDKKRRNGMDLTAIRDILDIQPTNGLTLGGFIQQAKKCSLQPQEILSRFSRLSEY